MFLELTGRYIDCADLSMIEKDFIKRAEYTLVVTLKNSATFRVTDIDSINRLENYINANLQQG